MGGVCATPRCRVWTCGERGSTRLTCEAPICGPRISPSRLCARPTCVARGCRAQLCSAPIFVARDSNARRCVFCDFEEASLACASWGRERDTEHHRHARALGALSFGDAIARRGWTTLVSRALSREVVLAVDAALVHAEDAASQVAGLLASEPITRSRSSPWREPGRPSVLGVEGSRSWRRTNPASPPQRCSWSRGFPMMRSAAHGPRYDLVAVPSTAIGARASRSDWRRSVAGRPPRPIRGVGTRPPSRVESSRARTGTRTARRVASGKISPILSGPAAPVFLAPRTTRRRRSRVRSSHR